MVCTVTSGRFANSAMVTVALIDEESGRESRKARTVISFDTKKDQRCAMFLICEKDPAIKISSMFEKRAPVTLVSTENFIGKLLGGNSMLFGYFSTLMEEFFFLVLRRPEGTLKYFLCLVEIASTVSFSFTYK